MRAVYVLLCLPCVACGLNFDQFDPSKDGAAPGDAGVSDGAKEGGGGDGGVDSGGCSPSQSCTGAAQNCGGNCRNVYDNCRNQCGQNQQCRQGCSNTRDQCINGCISTCVGCTGDAGCASQSACQNAANN
jgi:hypothetical protein